MSILGGAAQTTGRNRDVIRTIPFNQTVVNPLTSSFQNPYGNVIRVQFPYPQSFTQSELALQNFFIFNSWYNISAELGNNVFAYTFPTASGQETFSVTIPDGFYNLEDLNDYLQTIVMVNNGTYLISTVTGNNVYYIQILVNDTYYRATVFLDAVPDPAEALAMDLTAPANYPGGGLPATATTPQLVILPTPYPAGSDTPGQYSFSKYLGYTPGSYPPAPLGATVSYNGQFAPQVESTNNVNLSCNMVNNSGLSTNTQFFYSFSAANVPFGNQIIVNPHFPVFIPVADGFYNYIEIYVLDDNQQALLVQDPHISGTVMIRGK
jgi:hypothetical protein